MMSHVVMDKYRPEYRLDRLRMMLYGDRSSSDGRHEGMSVLHLRWLRTIVVDVSHTAERGLAGRLALQWRSAVGCAVERVVCKDLINKKHLALLLSLVTQCVPLLTSLDLRGCEACNVDDDFLLAVASACGLSLLRLYLPECSGVAQSTLDRFTQLEELDASECENLTNVDFCSTTLRVLYANKCYNLTDAGLRRATRLEVLHARDCDQVMNLCPFAHCLLELDASYRCGIGSGALSDCRRFQVLHAYRNFKITTLRPFAQRLRELDAGCSVLNDAALADATNLVSLLAYGSRGITTVAPFGASLRRLNAGFSMIGDAGLVTATSLVYLDASVNNQIHSVAPFSASLLELKATHQSAHDIMLSGATNLIWLDVTLNKEITTVQSCGRSLRHLVASGASCALTNEGLCTATQLTTYIAYGNPNLTTMEPFLHSLEELRIYNYSECLEVELAPNLHYIEGGLVNRCIAQLERNGFFDRKDIRDETRTVIENQSSTIVKHRNTVTYELCIETEAPCRMCQPNSVVATEKRKKKRANERYCCGVM